MRRQSRRFIDRRVESWPTYERHNRKLQDQPKKITFKGRCQGLILHEASGPVGTYFTQGSES